MELRLSVAFRCPGPRVVLSLPTQVCGSGAAAFGRAHLWEAWCCPLLSPARLGGLVLPLIYFASRRSAAPPSRPNGLEDRGDRQPQSP